MAKHRASKAPQRAPEGCPMLEEFLSKQALEKAMKDKRWGIARESVLNKRPLNGSGNLAKKLDNRPGWAASGNVLTGKPMTKAQKRAFKALRAKEKQ